jgi:hypothetical protein
MPVTGDVKTISGPRFTVDIEKMVCARAPKNLKHNTAHAGKHKLGLRFNSTALPPVNPLAGRPGA